MCDASTAWLIAAFIVGAMFGATVGFLVAALFHINRPDDRDEVVAANAHMRAQITRVAASTSDRVTARQLRDLLSD